MLNTEVPNRIIKAIRSKKMACDGPYYIEISPVGYCNFSCVQCHQLHHKEIDQNRTSTQQSLSLPIARLRYFIKEVAAMDVKEIEICGRGEPTLYPDLAELVSVIKEHDIYCSLVTNGTCLTPQLADKLIISGLDTLHVSMYAGTEEVFKKITGSCDEELFSNIIANITYLSRKMSEKKIDLRIVWLLQEDNIPELKDIVKRANSFKLDSQWFSSILPYRHKEIFFYPQESAHTETIEHQFDTGLRKLVDEYPDMEIPKNFLAFKSSAKENMDTSGSFYHRVPCYAGWWGMFLADDGTVRPCSNSNLILGNIHSRSAQEIWCSNDYKKFRVTALSYMILNKKPLPESYCSHCGWIPANRHIHTLVTNKHKSFFRITNLKKGLINLLQERDAHNK